MFTQKITNCYNIPTSFVNIAFLNIFLPYNSSCCDFFSILHLHPFSYFYNQPDIMPFTISHGFNNRIICMKAKKLICHPTCSSNFTFSRKRFHINIFNKIGIIYFIVPILWTLTKTINIITNISEKSGSVLNMRT